MFKVYRAQGFDFTLHEFELRVLQAVQTFEKEQGSFDCSSVKGLSDIDTWCILRKLHEQGLLYNANKEAFTSFSNFIVVRRTIYGTAFLKEAVWVDDHTVGFQPSFSESEVG